MPSKAIKHQLTFPFELPSGSFLIGRIRILVIPRNHLVPSWCKCECGISSNVTHVYCKRIQADTDKVMHYGKGDLMTKFELTRAYRAFPIRECDRYLSGMYWKDHYYVDLALPFGLSKAPNIFSRRATSQNGLLRSLTLFQRMISSIFSDDFFEVGPPDSNQCENCLDTILAICV